MVTKVAEQKSKRALPSTERAAKGLSLNALLKSAVPLVKNNAEECVIKAYNPDLQTKGGMPAVRAKVVNMLKRGHEQHTVTVIGLDKDIHTIAKQKRIQVDCTCVTGDTKVLTSGGWKRIIDIAEPLDLNTSYTTEYVVNGTKYLGTAPFYTGRKPVWTIQASNGRHIEATEDHKFLVYKSCTGAEKVWRKLKNLRVGDRLCVDSFLNSEIDKNSTAFYEGLFLGVLMGDGTIDKNTGSADLHLWGHKKELLELVSRAGVVSKVKELTLTAGRNKSGIRVAFNNRAKEIISRYDFRNKVGVNLTDPSMIMGYISGLVGTDGTITKTIAIVGGLPYLKQLQEYMQGLGFGSATIHKTASVGQETNIASRKKDLYGLRVCYSDLYSLKESLVLTKHNEARMNKLLSTVKNRVRRSAATVQNIVYSGRKDVYDINVPGRKRFNANGFIVHNCEFFLYRSEYALWTWGAAKIKRSNGQPATVTNPGNHPLGGCKHIYAVLKLIKQRGD